MKKLVFTIPTLEQVAQCIKFTGDTLQVEALLGELSTLDAVGGTPAFALTEAQYPNASTFAASITQQDGTRVNSSNIVSNMFINKFAIVKRIEVTGAFIVAAEDPSNIFTGAPICTGEMYQGGLAIANRYNLTFNPDNNFVSGSTGASELAYSRFYWTGVTLFGAFTNWCIRVNSTITPATFSNVVFYFDEVKPMLAYPEALKSINCWQ